MMFLFEKLGATETAIRILCAYLCQFLYSVIAGIFNVFIDVAKFSFTDFNYKIIYNRITVILELIMVFYVTFEFIKYIVQPETISDKDKGVGKIGLKIVIVVVSIAFVPSIFEYAYKLQGAIIDNGVISKLILGKQIDSDDEEGKPGGAFATLMLDKFYRYDKDLNGDQNCEDKIKCETIYNTNMRNLSSGGKLYSLPLGLSAATYDSDNSLVPLIEFDGIFAVVVGGLIAYMLILYSIDLGARIFQMMFLQIIAPIPIIGYLSPKKDNMFVKWGKQCLVTYIDVFIRLALMYFIILMSQLISDALEDIIKNSWGNKLLFIALVLGLLMFAQRVPKLLGELFPKSSTAASGNFGLKPGDRNLGRAIGAALGLTAGAAAGAASGLAQGLRKANSVEGKGRKVLAGLTGGAWGAVRGTLGGATRGFASGVSKSSNEGLGKLGKNLSTGISKQFKSNQTYGNKAEAGYTLAHQMQDKIGGALGMSRTEIEEKRKAPNERLVKERNAESDYRKKVADKSFENAVNKGKGSSDSRVKAAVNRYRQIEQLEKDLAAPDSEIRKQFRVGGEKQDAASQARIQGMKRASDTARRRIDGESFASLSGRGITGEDVGIKRMDYYDPVTKGFNQAAYEAAVVKAYKQKAYAKVEEKYQKDLQSNGLVYANIDEAQKDLAIAQQKVIEDKKKAKDAVQFAYEDWAYNTRDASGNIVVNDEELYRWQQEERQRTELYNHGATSEHTVNKEAEVNAIMFDMAVEKYANDNGVPASTVTASQAQSVMSQISRAEAEDKWNKTVVANSKQEAQMVVNEATARQEEIKRETAGSDNNKK